MVAVRQMLQFSCAVMAVVSSCAASAQVRVRAVDLYGSPISDVDVRIMDADRVLYPRQNNLTDANGIAELDVQSIRQTGFATLRVNMEGGSTERITRRYRNARTGYIGRIKKVRWSERDEFDNGFAVPLWSPGEVSSLADAVVRNPSHIAVAVRLGISNGTGSRIIAEVDEDVDWWIANVVPNLPQVSDPYLARALFEQTEPGEILSSRFDAAMSNVFAEVQRQNAAARVCRQFPQAVFPPPRQRNPWPQNPAPPGNSPNTPSSQPWPSYPSMPPPQQPIVLNKTPMPPPPIIVLPQQTGGCCLLSLFGCFSSNPPQAIAQSPVTTYRLSVPTNSVWPTIQTPYVIRRTPIQ